MIKMSHLVILPLALFGCATNTPQNKLQNVSNVGVVSVFDDQMPIRYVGTTASKTKDLSANTSKWSLNQTIVGEVRSELGKMNKTSLDIALDPQRLQAGRNEAQGLKNIYLGNRYQGLERYFLEEAEKQGAQYLFVLHPVVHEDFPQYKPGYGFLCSALTGKGNLEAYFLLRAELWNVKTNEVIARTTVTPQDVAFKTGKSCDEAAKMSSEKIAALYKEQVLDLAKKSANLVLSGTGVTQTK